MTKEQREENQRYYIQCCQEEGWLDEQCREVWPDDPEARAEMGRGFLGLTFMNRLDSVFLRWSDFAANPSDPPGVTSGGRWRPGFAALSPEQREFAMQVIDAVLKDAATAVCRTLDRFEHGELSIHLTTMDEQGKPRFNVQIEPHGVAGMYQDYFAWESRFGRAEDIGRNSGRV